MMLSFLPSDQDPSFSVEPQKLASSMIAAAAKSLQSCLTLCNPIVAAHQALPCLGFSRQEHWSGLPFP